MTLQINNQLRYSLHQAVQLFLSSQLLRRPCQSVVTSPWRRLLFLTLTGHFPPEFWTVTHVRFTFVLFLFSPFSFCEGNICGQRLKMGFLGRMCRKPHGGTWSTAWLRFKISPQWLFFSTTWLPNVILKQNLRTHTVAVTLHYWLILCSVEERKSKLLWNSNRVSK